MSILFPDYGTAYFIPEKLSEWLKKISGINLLPSEKGASEIFGGHQEEICNDEPLVPTVSSSTLEEFCTTHCLESHPNEERIGFNWCVISYKNPPSHKLDTHYLLSLNYAFMERYDAVLIEPFHMSEKVIQWLNVGDVIYCIFGTYLACLGALFAFTNTNDPSPAIATIFNCWLLTKYKEWIMGDPASSYRLLDMDRKGDAQMAFDVSPMFEVRSNFPVIVLLDERREKFRYTILRVLIGYEIGIVTGRYLFSWFL